MLRFLELPQFLTYVVGKKSKKRKLREDDMYPGNEVIFFKKY